MRKILSLLLIFIGIIGIKSDKADQVVNFAKSKLKCGYVWGSSGQILNEQNLKEFMKNGHVDEKRVRKWMGVQVYDCASLVVAAFNSVGIKIKSGGATSSWTKTDWLKKDTINTLPKDKVCVLFREGEGKMQHTGNYIRNNLYIHAKGSDDGVKLENLSGSRWTHWAMPKGLYDDKDTETPSIVIGDDKTCASFPCQAKLVATSGSTVNFRKSNSKSSTILARIKLGTIVTVTGESNGWCSVTYNNMNGYIMSEFLVKA